MIRSSIESKLYIVAGADHQKKTPVEPENHQPDSPTLGPVCFPFSLSRCPFSSSLPNPRPIFPLGFVFSGSAACGLVLADGIYLPDIVEQCGARLALASDVAAPLRPARHSPRQSLETGVRYGYRFDFRGPAGSNR